MEIRRLHLAAFGPFTDRRLEFGHPQNGLTIVYGPNEAGKSSALRGLTALLFGIPEHTPDNFIHAYKQMRIEGHLCNADGRELRIVRRKGRKNTLLSPSDEVLDEMALTPFLAGVTRELFQTLFGIDHNALVRGGEAILAQQGAVGQLLFSAGLGGQALHSVLAELEQEADALFRPRGSTQTINNALKNYVDLSREGREVSLSSSQWEEQRRELEQTTLELDKCRAQLARARSELTRLQRIQRTLPKLARRLELVRKVEELGDVQLLADEFGGRRLEAIKGADEAKAIERRADARIKTLQQQLDGIEVRDAVLEQAETIESIHERLGGYRQAQQDLLGQNARYKQLRADVEVLLKELRPDLAVGELDSLRPVLARRARIVELGSQHQALTAQCKQIEQARKKRQTQLEDAESRRRKLPQIGPIDALRKVVAVARKSGDLDQTIETTDNEAQALEDQCVTELARLSIWERPLADIPAMSAPSRLGIEQFETAFDGLSTRNKQLLEKRQDIVDKLNSVERELEEMNAIGELPTEQQLVDARSQRDVGWRLLRRQWVDEEDLHDAARNYDPELSLIEAYEQRVNAADRLADRLRFEAERILKHAGRVAERAEYKRRNKEVATQLRECKRSVARLEKRWAQLWADCEVSPRSPREMRDWLEGLQRVRDKITQLQQLQRKSTNFRGIRDRHTESLIEQLSVLGQQAPEPGGALEPVLEIAEELVETTDQTIRQRERLGNEIDTLTGDLRALDDQHHAAGSDLETWFGDWTRSIVEFARGQDLSPAEANALLEKLLDMFAKYDDGQKLHGRIKALEQQIESFRVDVGDLIAQIAPELTQMASDQAVVRVNSLLQVTRSEKTRQRQLEEQLLHSQQEVREARAGIDGASELLDALCVEAGCDQPQQLEAIERRSNDYKRLRTEVADLERELCTEGDGATLEALEKEVEGVDVDELPGLIQALSESIANPLEPKQVEMANRKGRQEKALEYMDGGDRAAQLAVQVQGVVAAVRGDVEQYTRLRFASYLLRREIERYREENQGPLLKRAGEFFATLTGASFVSLRTDFDTRDEPILTGARPNGEQVGVEGMSSGTRDQLYLALRLASLEQYTRNSEPMPFIVDDILVDFDDQRAEAALRSLCDLADESQVIMFTHHARVVEQARGLDRETQVIAL